MALIDHGIFFLGWVGVPKLLGQIGGGGGGGGVAVPG